MNKTEVKMNWPKTVFTVETAANYNQIAKVTAKMKITEAVKVNVLRLVGKDTTMTGPGRRPLQYELVEAAAS